MGFNEIKELLANPYTWIGLGTAALVGVWWWGMTPNTANLTLVFGVVAFALAAFLHPWIGKQPGLVRFMWTLAVFAMTGLAAYYTLWTTTENAPPPGLRVRQIEFSVPRVNERMFAVVSWENTSDNNITTWGGTTVYTIGLDASESLPIRAATEAMFEEFGEREQATAVYDEVRAEHPPGDRFVSRHGSDPKTPLTQFEIDELAAGRARTYVTGVIRWTVDGAEHGCHFCAWTSTGGFGQLCRKGNRCY